MPNHGLFVERRTQNLASAHNVSIEVVAPVPWFPGTSELFGTYARFARAPREDVRQGIQVHYPRYLTIPKVGMTMAPYLMALGAYSTIRKRQQSGFDFDIIDAHYFYPDGVAASILAKTFAKPFLITARGSDINLIAQYKIPRAMIRKAAMNASHVITVSESLKRSIEDLGIAPGHITHLRNGVDLDMFQAADRPAAIEQCASTSNVLLSVGNLVELKGHHLVIDAMTKLPGCHLFIIGDGPMRSALMNQVTQQDLTKRVHLVGPVDQSDLAAWYSSADALILASSREGMPNVVLESLACGTPVVATAVGGIPEVIENGRTGQLVERSSQAIADGVRELLANPPDRASTRTYAEQFSWDPTISRLRSIMAETANRDNPSL